MSFRTANTVTLQTTVSFTSFQYQITGDEEHSVERKKWEHPETIADFQTKKQLGTDNNFLHFSVSIDLDDYSGKRVGEPDQVYLSFKKADWNEGKQLSINAQA